MQAVYHLEMRELTDDFIKKLKSQFESGVLDIVVSEYDDTDYLVASIKNEKTLDASIKEIENAELVKKSIKDFS
jgi:antitoxin YefM